MTSEEICASNSKCCTQLKDHAVNFPVCPSKSPKCPINTEEKLEIFRKRMTIVNLAKYQMKELRKVNSDSGNRPILYNRNKTTKFRLKKYAIVTAVISLWTILLLTSAYVGGTVCSAAPYLVNDDEDVYINSIF